MTPPSAAQIIEYWARPMARLGGSVIKRRGQGRPGFRALDLELAHVRQVEQPDPLADRPVLLDDRAVLDRHQPATELDEPRPEGPMRLGQRCPVDGRLHRVGHGAVSATGRADAVPGCAITRPARATSARSVSKVSIVAASANEIQRTSSNSWSCLARSPPIGSIRK